MSTAAPIAKNCHATQVYQCDVQVPNVNTGILGAPALGAVTGITLRISATRNGSAINAAVNALPASERATIPGRFWVSVSKALHETYLLPLGKGTSYFVIWSKNGEFDFYVEEFYVADETVVS